jgi:dihydroorotase
MPNLRPPVTTVARRPRIAIASSRRLPAGARFTPLMTLLPDRRDHARSRAARASGFVHAIKYYPAGATTNSESGVTALERAVSRRSPAMERCGMVLACNGEVTDPTSTCSTASAVFIDRHLGGSCAIFPRCASWSSTRPRASGAVRRRCAATVAATLTPQHLDVVAQRALRRRACAALLLPAILKREEHRRALVARATSGNPKFFLGTDSAHPAHRQGSELLLARLLLGAARPRALLRRCSTRRCARPLDAFASEHGPRFYGLPRNEEPWTLVAEPWTVPASYPFGDDTVVPLCAGETCGGTVRA